MKAGRMKVTHRVKAGRREVKVRVDAEAYTCKKCSGPNN